MGWRFRKSKQVGPLRLTFSKSGVGKSFGGRFFRVTETATGEKRLTFTIPGTGVSWVKSLSGGRRRRRGYEQRDYEQN